MPSSPHWAKLDDATKASLRAGLLSALGNEKRAPIARKVLEGNFKKRNLTCLSYGVKWCILYLIPALGWSTIVLLRPAPLSLHCCSYCTTILLNRQYTVLFVLFVFYIAWYMCSFAPKVDFEDQA